METGGGGVCVDVAVSKSEIGVDFLARPRRFRERFGA